MKRVAVISRHNVSNYGSVLQAYAIEHVLRQLGYEPVTVDYRRSAETEDALVARYSDGRSLPHRIYRHTIWRQLRRRGEKHFRAMQENYLTLSDPCDETNIWERIPKADVYLTGSDQVWNDLGDGALDGAFFWSRVETTQDNPLVSYAASFGRDSVLHGYEDRVGEWLSRYAAISVREDTGVRIVEGYDLKAEHVLDPTLLLDGSCWSKLAGGGSSKHEYALVYNLHRDQAMLDYVRDKTAGSGLDIVSVCPTYRKRIGRNIIMPSLPEFLSLFRNASCVYTDSFHGTAFSINFRTPFVAVYPQENADRNRSVLRLFGLEGRESSVFEGDGWKVPIDWDAVHVRLNAERARCISWLDNALGGADE